MVLHLAFFKIALIGVLLLLEDQFSSSGCYCVLKGPFVPDCIVLDASLNKHSIFPLSLVKSLQIGIFVRSFAVGFALIKRAYINPLLGYQNAIVGRQYLRAIFRKFSLKVKAVVQDPVQLFSQPYQVKALFMEFPMVG